jgi:xylulokinase
LAAVQAIGLSGQMHSPVLLGNDGRPLLPALLWNDGRGREEARALAARLPELATITGVVPMAGLSAAKLLWIAEHRPATFAGIRHVLLPKDYVRLWLTGDIASDMSDAAGTQLLDEAKRRWWEPAVNAVGLDLTQLPPLKEGNETAGRLRPSLAAELGLPKGVLVATGGGDAGTGAVGIGCVDHGDGFVSLGTSAVFVVVSERYAPKPETMLHNFAHCLPARWYQMAGMLNGASAVRWALDMLGRTDIATAMAEVEAHYDGPSPLLFLPYLTGERTPHNNPDARGAFFGLTAGTSRADILQAVMEGVAFSLADARACLIAAGSDCPAPAFIGGGSRNRLWGQIIADVTGLELSVLDGADTAPAIGAALLGAAALSQGKLPARPQKETTRIRPNAARTAAYAPRYEAYRALYTATSGLL